MTTRGILNLLLLLGVAALGLVVIYQPGIKPPPPPVKLTTLQPDQITSIRIDHVGRPAIIMEKQAGHWRITAPRPLPGDDGRINSLLRLVQETSQARLPAKPADLRKYKLDHPNIRLTFDKTVFAFGDTDALNGRRYVQVGDTVHLITDMYYYQLDGDLASFVSTHLLPDKATITALTLPAVTLQRDAQGHWQMQPEKPGVSADAIQTLIDAWRQGNALWVKPYKSGVSQGSVTVTLANPAETLHFDIMATQPELILARPDIGMQYHLSPDNAKTLLDLAITATPTPTVSPAPSPAASPVPALSPVPSTSPAPAPPSSSPVPKPMP